MYELDYVLGRNIRGGRRRRKRRVESVGLLIAHRKRGSSSTLEALLFSSREKLP